MYSNVQTTKSCVHMTISELYIFLAASVVTAKNIKITLKSENIVPLKY